MNVLFVIAEADPFIKVGGLGDVGGSLPIALQEYAANVRVMMPKYSSIPGEYRRQMKPVTRFSVGLGWRKIPCQIEELDYRGVKYYFLDNEYYFQRDAIYGYEDEGERYAYFCKAVLESLTHINFQPQVIHCNDWHTALIPLMLQEDYGHDPYYYGIKSVLTIHNLRHQGWVPLSYFEDVFGWGGHKRAWGKLEYHGRLNYLKAGILVADGLTTVSPTYAREIQKPYYGENLHGFLRERRHELQGILNGIDTSKYNPHADLCLVAQTGDPGVDKEANKRHLQETVGLPVRSDVAVLAVVSRLVDQKGLDLLAHVLEEILWMDIQMIVLGTGEEHYEAMFNHFAHKYPDTMAVRLIFDEGLAHKIYGGADMLLMPSQFEPCGLSQMIAMRYGTIPIVRETGGLRDSVQPYNEFTGEGNGFSFANYNAHELLFTVQRAVNVFYNEKKTWQRLRRNAMQMDFSWATSAQQYYDLYRSLIRI